MIDIDSACALVQERIGELDTEIVGTAADTLRYLARKQTLSEFVGAARRVLTDRIIERLALQALLDAREAAIEAEQAATDARRAEYAAGEPARREAARIEALAKRLLELEAQLSDALSSAAFARRYGRPHDEHVRLMAAALREYRTIDIRDIQAARRVVGKNFWKLDKLDEHVRSAIRVVAEKKAS